MKIDIPHHSIPREYFEDIREKKSRVGELAAFYLRMHEEENAEYFEECDRALAWHELNAGRSGGYELWEDIPECPYNPQGLYRTTTYENKAESILNCAQFWTSDYYRLQQVKDIKKVNLCRDKFCYNCQSMLAVKRQAKYAPILDEFSKDYQLCHVVLTVPNCSAALLKLTVKRMYVKFKYLTRYLSGDARIADVNLMQYGYAGGVRSLEITQNGEDQTFHPHFHCILLLRKGLKFPRRYVNCYSFDKGKLVRKFSELEVILQKLWFLIWNGKRVTRQSLNELAEGYSVICDDVAKGEYHEVFKYTCKGAFKDGSIYNYETFKTLYHALRNRRIIQGYGLCHNFRDEAMEVLEDDVEQSYQEIIEELMQLEEPVEVHEHLDEVIAERNSRYISKSNLKRLLMLRMREEREHE